MPLPKEEPPKELPDKEEPPKITVEEAKTPVNDPLLIEAIDDWEHKVSRGKKKKKKIKKQEDPKGKMQSIIFETESEYYDSEKDSGNNKIDRIMLSEYGNLEEENRYSWQNSDIRNRLSIGRANTSNIAVES